MRLLFTLLFSIICIGAWSQGKKLKKDPNEKRVLDQFNENHIPESAVWMGEPNYEKYQFIEDRILIYNFWSPLNPRHYEVLSELSKVKEEFPQVEIIDFLHPADLELFTEDEAYRIWRTFENKRPIVIGVNDFVKSNVTSRLEDKLMVSADRGGVTYLSSEGLLNTLRKDFKEYFDQLKSKELSSLPTHLLNQISRTSFLSFPKGIASDRNNALLYIADSGNNRIVAIEEDGVVLDIIGNGKSGFVDGSYASCSFNNPTGVAVDRSNNALYVADTYNHVIRKIDLFNKKVSTVLGTGSKAAILESKIVRKNSAIAYPSRLFLKDGKLYITMTESNKVYEMDVESGEAILVLGTGMKSSVDGKQIEATTNSPVGLTDLNGQLYVLESQVPKVRIMKKNKVMTLYSNKSSDSLQLNLPQSIHALSNSLYVMDAFNHSVRSINLDGEISHVVGGVKGFKDGVLDSAQFNGPTDMCVMNGSIFIVDALNNAVRKVNPSTKKVSTLEFSQVDDYYPSMRLEEMPKVSGKAMVREGNNLIAIELILPSDHQFSGSQIQIESRVGSVGKVVDIDSDTGLILYGADISDFTETTYLTIEFISERKDVPEMKYKNGVRLLLQYEQTDASNLMPIKVNL